MVHFEGLCDGLIFVAVAGAEQHRLLHELLSYNAGKVVWLLLILQLVSLHAHFQILVVKLYLLSCRYPLEQTKQVVAV